MAVVPNDIPRSSLTTPQMITTDQGMPAGAEIPETPLREEIPRPIPREILPLTFHITGIALTFG